MLVFVKYGENVNVTYTMLFSLMQLKVYFIVVAGLRTGGAGRKESGVFLHLTVGAKISLFVLCTISH